MDIILSNWIKYNVVSLFMHKEVSTLKKSQPKSLKSPAGYFSITTADT